MSTAVITIAHGRRDHLRRQQYGLAAGSEMPAFYVVVGMDDPDVLSDSLSGPLTDTGCQVIPAQVPAQVVDGRLVLPLAAARNAGAAAALAHGADTLILLDVDCIPSAELVATYRKVVDADRSQPPAEAAPRVYCGVVRYLDAAQDFSSLPLRPETGVAHQARPTPAAGDMVLNEQWQLFWSLSFAVDAQNWCRLGGFDEAYRGYGGEDTDLGYRAFRAGWQFCWVGGADAHHQYHPTQRPPVQHVADIVRNTGIFRDRWGFDIMAGWLEAFAERGLVAFDPQAGRWRELSDITAAPDGAAAAHHQGATTCR